MEKMATSLFSNKPFEGHELPYISLKGKKIIAIDDELEGVAASILYKNNGSSDYYVATITKDFTLNWPSHTFSFKLKHTKANNNLFMLSATECVVTNVCELYALKAEECGQTKMHIYQNNEFPARYTISYDGEALIAIHRKKCWRISFKDLLEGVECADIKELAKLKTNTRFVVETASGEMVEFEDETTRHIGRNIYMGLNYAAFEVNESGKKESVDAPARSAMNNIDVFYKKDGSEIKVEREYGRITISHNDKILEELDSEFRSRLCTFIEKDDGVYIFVPGRNEFIFVNNRGRKRKAEK